MPPLHPAVPPVAAPIRKTFDPWNSSSTGHQRAENRLGGSTSWRQSRTTKLGYQFASGAGGVKRMFDSVGAGSKDFGKDGRKENGSWENGAKGLRLEGWRDVGLMMNKGSQAELEAQKQEKEGNKDEYPETRLEISEGCDGLEGETTKTKKPRVVFQGLGFYINGSTAPLVSDHKLKRLLAENGGRICLGLARRSVTHVIVGRPNGTRHGAGGGLSGTKIEKEIQRVRGCGVKFVNVEWVLECLNVGKKLPEYEFEGVKIAPKGVGSVVGMFRKQELKKPKSLEAKRDQDGRGLC